MLTQQQADDYNIWQHELEAIEIGQNIAQKQINSYVDALSKVSDMMATATPEMMNRIKTVMPKLVEGYNNAKLKLSSYEDRHQQALSKVNEYKALETQPTSTPVTKRRIAAPTVTPTTDPNQYQTPITEGIGWTSTPNGPRYGGGIQPVINTRPQQYQTPITEGIGWTSTPNGPRYGGGIQPVVNTKPQQYQTPITEGIGWTSTPNGPRYGGGINLYS